MKLLTRFFYEEGSAGEGGGSSSASDATGNEGGNNAPGANVQAELPEDIKRELEELRAYRDSNKPAEVKSPEQIAKETEKRKADLISYSVEEGLMKVDDFSKYETLSQKADRELVYESWFENWKTENPDVDPSEVAEKAKADFEDEYKMSSQNEKTKTRGESRLQKEANELRGPLVNSYKTAETQFNAYQTAKENFPKFQKAIDDIVAESVPEELVYATKEGEEDVVIEGVKLTAEDKKEISKLFSTQKYFVPFLQNKGEIADLKKDIAKKIQGYLSVKYSRQIQDQIYEKAKGIGMKQGSNVGAGNPYGTLPKNAGQGGATVIPIDNSKANDAAKKARQANK